MLSPQESSSGTHRRQGSRRASLAELRRQLAEPAGLNDAHRQRLTDLARRLARVQALGNEYARVELSHYVHQAVTNSGVDVAIAR